jgi:hypothetical protein
MVENSRGEKSPRLYSYLVLVCLEYGTSTNFCVPCDEGWSIGRGDFLGGRLNF